MSIAQQDRVARVSCIHAPKFELNLSARERPCSTPVLHCTMLLPHARALYVLHSQYSRYMRHSTCMCSRTGMMSYTRTGRDCSYYTVLLPALSAWSRLAQGWAYAGRPLRLQTLNLLWGRTCKKEILRSCCLQNGRREKTKRLKPTRQ